MAVPCLGLIGDVQCQTLGGIIAGFGLIATALAQLHAA